MGRRLIITEEERGSISSMYDIINEQKIPLLTILRTPDEVGFDHKDNSNIIYLTLRDEDDFDKVIPNSKYSYKISGEYDAGALAPNISFDVKLNQAERVFGYLLVLIKPDNSVVNLAMQTLIPKNKLTSDGFLSLMIPPKKVNDAIRNLKSGGGNSSVITLDKAPGLKIILTKI
jgi:hypothetical protein